MIVWRVHLHTTISAYLFIYLLTYLLTYFSLLIYLVTFFSILTLASAVDIMFHILQLILATKFC